MEVKKCVKCEREKELSEFRLCSDKIHYLNACKRCLQDRTNELKRIKRRKENPERYEYKTLEERLIRKKETTKLWREKNWDRIKEQGRNNQAKYLKEDKNNYREKKRLSTIKWREKNKEHVAEYRKKWRAGNRERDNKSKADYHKKYPEKKRLWDKKSFQKNGINRDSYYRNILVKRSKELSAADISENLLETYKLYIQLKREVKNGTARSI